MFDALTKRLFLRFKLGGDSRVACATLTVSTDRAADGNHRQCGKANSIRAEALLRESGAIAAQNYGPDHPNTRSAQADLAIASVLAQDWPEAERRLEAILAWLDASGRGEKRLARYLRAARAYVRARRTPSTDTISAALELLRTEDWEGGLFQRNAEDWVRWLEAARARGTLSG